MDITEITDILTFPAALNLLGESAGPFYTHTQLTERAANYQSDDQTKAFGAWENGVLTGLAIVTLSLYGEAVRIELRGIAVTPAQRNHGTGTALISYLRKKFTPGLLTAETDDDAVGFYRALGFSVTSLGELYPGTIRYQCTLPL